MAKQQAGARVALLSDSNSVFMSHLLAGAKAGPLVDEVLTNPAAFERAAAGPAPMPGVGLGLGAAAALPVSPNGAGSSSVGQKLVVKPRRAALQGRPVEGQQGHHRCCGACPASLCRGAEVAVLKQRGAARRIVYCGDGAADVCAALALGSEDVVLARRGGRPGQAGRGWGRSCAWVQWGAGCSRGGAEGQGRAVEWC